MMINCKEAARLECIALDRPLTRFEKVRLKFHHSLCRCPVCCAHQEQLEYFEKIIFYYRESMSCCEQTHKKRLCQEARDRICRKLREELNADQE